MSEIYNQKLQALEKLQEHIGEDVNIFLSSMKDFENSNLLGSRYNPICGKLISAKLSETGEETIISIMHFHKHIIKNIPLKDVCSIRFMKEKSLDEKEIEKNTHNIRGLLRLTEVLKIIPIGRSTWFRGIEDGIYPAPIKLSPRIPVWKVEDIEKLLKNILEKNEK